MANGDGPSRPDWAVAGLRCALEITLVVLSTAYLAVHLDSNVLAGIVILLGTAGSAFLLFWCVKEQIISWIRYASRRSRRRRSTRQ